MLSRRIWLPRLAYASLPYFYIAAGLLALLATLYISHWTWLLPYCLLFSVACTHLGLVVIGKRRAGRGERTQAGTDDA